jgi:hypothetical protein
MQVSDVPVVTQTPITKVVPPPPPASYVQELWESLTTRKNPMGAISKTKEKTCIRERIWRAWVQQHAKTRKIKILM